MYDIDSLFVQKGRSLIEVIKNKIYYKNDRP